MKFSLNLKSQNLLYVVISDIILQTMILFRIKVVYNCAEAKVVIVVVGQ